MKKLMLFLFLAVPLLAGCVTETVGQPEMTPDRLKELARARTALAADYYGRRQYAVALQEVDMALRADSGYSPAYNMRALLHVALLEDKEAEDDFKRSLSLDSGNSEAHDNYGWFLCQRGREQDGIQQHLLAAKDPLYPGQARAYVNAATCAIKVNRLQDAQLYLDKARILQPDLPDTYFEMADLAYTMGDLPTARSNFQMFVKAVHNQLSAENLLLGVRIEHRLGNSGAQAAYAARLRQEYPDSREAQSLGQIR